MTTVTPLDYGPPPRRRRRLVLMAIGLIVALAAAAGWFVLGRAKPVVAKAVVNAKLARAFDDVEAELLAGGTTWSPATGRASAARADALLRSLSSVTASGAGRYLRSSNTVLFVRAGTTAGTKWLAFACMSPTGLEVFSFERGLAAAAGYDRLAETRPFFGSAPPDVKPREVTFNGDEVHTLLDINGQTNHVLWTFAPQAPPGNRTMAYVSGAFDVSAKPMTRWMSHGDWWPDAAGVRLLEAGAATIQLPAIAKPHAISCMPGARLAVVSPNEVGIIDVTRRSVVKTRKLPHPTREAEVFAFTLDGTSAFIGGTSDPAQVVDVLTGQLRWAGETAGMAKPAFAGSDVLMLADNVSFKRFDLARRVTEDMPAYATGTWHSAAVGNFLALVGRNSIDVYATDTGTRLWGATHHGFYPSVSISPGAKWLVSKSTDSLRAFDAVTGTSVWTHLADNDLHTSHSRIKWSLDGRRGAAAGNQYVYVWSLAEPRWVARFPHGRSGYHPDVTLTPDGRAMAASAAASSTIAYWPDIDAALGGTK